MGSVSLTMSLIAGSIVGLLPVVAAGQDGPVRDLVGPLGSEAYQERVEAQERLRDWAVQRPERAEVWLLAQLGAAAEPEVRARLREVLQEIVIAEYQRKEGKGYVGIRMEGVMIIVPGDEAPRAGVKIDAVEPETPANRAGLLAEDVIVAMDRRQWAADVDATQAFADAIKELKPGVTIHLEILRAGEVMEVAVTLAARPMGLPETRTLLWPNAGEEPLDLETLEKQARDEYFNRWLAGKRAEAEIP